MNRIQWMDFLREIRKNKGRFLSLLFIVALGCAFYSGIRSSEPDMTASADYYYDETDFCDIRLISTLGLTDDDLRAVAGTEGVLACEGGYSAELFATCENDEPIMSVVSLGDSINRFTIQEGRLPEKADECFVDVRYRGIGHCKIGDTITLHDTDGNAPELLDRDTYTIVGFGTWAWYLNLTRGTASIGDGSVDAFLVLRPETFTQDYYSTIYATVEGAKEVNSYSDRYDEIVQKIIDRLEGISEVRLLDRRNSLIRDGEAELADAREQIADARKELSDAYDQLTDGEAEYADGLQEYTDGKKALDDGRKAYEDGKRELEKGKKEYQDGLTAYEEGRKEYEDGLKEYEDGALLLEDGRAQLEDAKKELDDGWTDYEKGQADYEAGAALLAKNQQELSEGREALAEARRTLDENKALLEEQKPQLEAQKEALLAQQEELSSTKEELLTQKASVEQQKRFLEAALQLLNTPEEQYPAIQEALTLKCKELEEQLKLEEDPEEISRLQLRLRILRTVLWLMDETQTQLEEQKETLLAQIEEQKEALLTQLEDLISQAEDGLAQIDDGLSQIDDGLAQIEAGILQIDEGLSQIDDGFLQIAAGYEEIEANEAALLDAETQLAEGRKQLEDSSLILQEAYAQLQEGDASYEAGLKELAEKEKEFDEAGKLLEASAGQLADAQKELKAAADTIADGERELADAKAEIRDGEKELAEAGLTLADARSELDDGWKEYQDAKAEADEKIADAEAQIADGEQQLQDIPKGKWYVLARDTIQTCVEYGMDAERIGKIAKVFPVIFFLVAALVCLTTMTRMVEEERMLIGTMKALGYSKLSIIAKYLFYAFSATVLGGILGVLVGSKLLPFVIMKAYGMLYTNIPDYLLPYHLQHCLTAIGMALLFTVGAALFACYRELLATPASLMRPPAPKLGRKIILERIPAIWSRLNFSLKSTIRNLFRYKKRLFMTVFGIGGCMAILLVSYGLHDSIAAIVDNQYTSIWTYSANCGVDENLSPAEKSAAEEALRSLNNISDTMLARNASLDVSTAAGSKTAYIYVVEDTAKMAPFLDLHDRTTRESYSLTDDGVILSEKLARTLEVKPGDEITLKISDTEYRTARVTAAAENYLFSYVYMTPSVYREIFGEEVSFNEIVVRYDKALMESEEKALAEQMLSTENVTSVSLVIDLQKSVNNMLNALNLVVWVLVIAAGLLVFVVTYNLNNINISERRRELASLKVLGFYDGEVAMYVYRENIFLTLFGIIAGLFMGTWLHRYIITILEVEMIMFGRQIRVPSYIYSSLLTIAFSVVVNLFMYYKLRQIDMVESLKSVE